MWGPKRLQIDLLQTKAGEGQAFESNFFKAITFSVNTLLKSIAEREKLEVNFDFNLKIEVDEDNNSEESEKVTIWLRIRYVQV